MVYTYLALGTIINIHTYLVLGKIINNNYHYSLRWRWRVVDICWAAKRRDKYPPLLTDTEVNNNYCFSIYHTSWINSTKNYYICNKLLIEKWSNFRVSCAARCSNLNSTWLIMSTLANKHAPKALSTCVVYANYHYLGKRGMEKCGDKDKGF